ncbi:uncharacterized protein J3R85_005297 [Psidium guajava]|nr:uncharacterized protein J3R85_005297 [Psidium guajava]
MNSVTLRGLSLSHNKADYMNAGTHATMTAIGFPGDMAENSSPSFRMLPMARHGPMIVGNGLFSGPGATCIDGYTSKMPLAAIDENHSGTYDFLYLPIDFKNKCNVGYAFINMVSPWHIVSFYKTFNGKKWEKFNSEKVASLAYARIQGKAAFVTHFENSSLMNEDKRCRPIVFHSEGQDTGDKDFLGYFCAVVYIVNPEKWTCKDEPHMIEVVVSSKTWNIARHMQSQENNSSPNVPVIKTSHGKCMELGNILNCCLTAPQGISQMLSWHSESVIRHLIKHPSSTASFDGRINPPLPLTDSQ